VKVDQALATYGRRFGLAFQITDDLLDVEGDRRPDRQRVGKDSVKGKADLPGFLGVGESANGCGGFVRRSSGGRPAAGPSAERWRPWCGWSSSETGRK